MGGMQQTPSTTAPAVTESADPAWDEFYSHAHTFRPTPFAQWARDRFENEIRPAFVIDLACGNGRDALFFAGMQVPVVGVDRSESGIEAAEQHVRERNAD